MFSDYDVTSHSHAFCAWAAGRAAMAGKRRKGLRGFTVANARTWLERAGLDTRLRSPDDLPSPDEVDAHHEEWRSTVIEASSNDLAIGKGSTSLSHGQAAKLLNVYLKGRFVVADYANHPRVICLHPPIDGELLKGLNDAGHFGGGWMKIRWSNLSSAEYQSLIDRMRGVIGDQPLWKIEKFWPGYR